MQLGIYAPYDRGGITAGALRLAGLAQSLSFSVSYLVSMNRGLKIHPYWDGRVLTAKKESIQGWINKSLICVWFLPDYRFYRGAIEGCNKRTHILVPSWHNFSPGCSLAGYDRIICTSVAAARAFYAHTPAGHPAMGRRDGVEFTRWTSGVGPMRREGLVKSGRIRVFVPVGSRTLKEHGADLLAVIDTLLATHEHVEITLSRTRPGNKLMQQRNSRLLRDYPGRFRECCRLSADEQLSHIHEHDWMWIPDTQSENGLPAQQAVSCGVPVIAWSLPPLTEVVKHGWTGKLVYCDHSTNWIGAPTAVWSTPALISVLNESLASTEPLFALQARDWPVGDVEANFLRFWREVLDA